MKRANLLYRLWLVLGAYGVWFAIFSGLEELSSGKFWKAGLSLTLALAVYVLTYARPKQ
jgi:hypothetical protein